MNFAEVARYYATDKYEHGYMPHYEHHLTEAPATVLELGIGQGGSLLMWSHLFPNARVMGIDIDPKYAALPSPIQDGEAPRGPVECHVGDATFIESFNGWLPPLVDLIVDDGSHHTADVLAAFDALWPRVAFGGWYVIEDLSCARHPQFGGADDGGRVLDMLRTVVLEAIAGQVVLHVYEEIAFVHRLGHYDRLR